MVSVHHDSGLESVLLKMNNRSHILLSKVRRNVSTLHSASYTVWHKSIISRWESLRIVEVVGTEVVNGDCQIFDICHVFRRLVNRRPLFRPAKVKKNQFGNSQAKSCRARNFFIKQRRNLLVTSDSSEGTTFQSALPLNSIQVFLIITLRNIKFAKYWL